MAPKKPFPSPRELCEGWEVFGQNSNEDALALIALLTAGAFSARTGSGAPSSRTAGLGFGTRFGEAARTGLGACAGSGFPRAAKAGLGLPAGTGLSFSARSGVGIGLGIGGAEVGCALGARSVGPGRAGAGTRGGPRRTRSEGAFSRVAAEAARSRSGTRAGAGGRCSARSWPSRSCTVRSPRAGLARFSRFAAGSCAAWAGLAAAGGEGARQAAFAAVGLGCAGPGRGGWALKTGPAGPGSVRGGPGRAGSC
jgi:hypothetical protein